MESRPTRLRHPWKARALLALASTVLAVLLAEAAVRLLHLDENPWAVPPKQTIDPYGVNPYIVTFRPFLHAHIPGSVYVQKSDAFEVTYEINSRGFRGPEIAQGPPQGVKRLLVIGDSIAEGHGVAFEETFASVLHRRMRSNGWEVVNVSVQGASPMYYAANLARYLALHPDAVLLVLFENDPFEDRLRSIAYPGWPILPDAYRLVEGREMQGRHISHLLSLLARERNRWRLRRNPTAVDTINARHRAENPLLAPGSRLAFPPFALNEREFAILWPVTRDYLDRVEQELRQRGIPLVVVAMAGHYLTDHPEEYRRRHADLFDASVRTWTTERNLPCLSLQKPLQDALAADEQRRVLLPRDYHLSPYGHRFVAETIHPWLMPHLAAAD